MTVIIVLIILAVVYLLFGQQIRRWLNGVITRFLANRTEDYIRKATGMPPRPDSREGRRRQREAEKAQRQASQSGQSYYGRRSSRRAGQSPFDAPTGHLIPKEYAEDVEFVEIVSYSQTTIGADTQTTRNTVYHENQVSDVEWEEIKTSRR